MDEAKIHKTVTLHASKSGDNARLVRQRLLQSRIIDLNAHIASLQPFTREVYQLKELDDIIFRRIDGWGRLWVKTYDGVFDSLVEKIPKSLVSAFSNVPDELVYFGFSNEVLAGISNDRRNKIKRVYTKVNLNYNSSVLKSTFKEDFRKADDKRAVRNKFRS